MLGQMIAAHERLGALDADELLLAGVRPLVTGQLVGARETPLAVGPLADERFLAGVDALVGFQVAGLEVVFAAIGVVAFVDASAALALLRRRAGG